MKRARRIALALGFAAAPAFAAPAAKPAYGILLLAHGGDPAWNAEIEKLRVAVASSAPAALALGMADPDTIQQAVDLLEAKHVSAIAVVPLFVNSNSEVMTQTRYALGLSETPSDFHSASSSEGSGAAVVARRA